MTLRITDYYVIEKDDLIDLGIEVAEFIEGDWEPIGGIAVRTTGSYDTTYLQAMIKRKAIL